MSYNNAMLEDKDSTTAYGYALTPMALDIAALHRLYGEVSNNYGDTTYSFDMNAPLDMGSGTHGGGENVSIGRGFFAIWDTGGIDTVDFSKNESNERALINLNSATAVYSAELTLNGQSLLTALTSYASWLDLPDAVKDQFQNPANEIGGYLSASFSPISIEGFTPGGFTIAKTMTGQDYTQIENAIGGDGDDLIVGNEAANMLMGGKGDDFIYGSGGADKIHGGAGDDQLRGGITIEKVGSEYVVVGSDGFADEMHGDEGNDYIYVGRDGDRAYGGADDDTFVLEPSNGNDKWSSIDGGSGTDILYISSADLEGQLANLVEYKTLGRIKITGVELFMVDWIPPAHGSIEWTAGPNSKTYSEQDLRDMYLAGNEDQKASFVTNGVNVAWSHVTLSSFTSFAAAQVPDTVVFSGSVENRPEHITGISGQLTWQGNSYALDMTWDAQTITAALQAPVDFTDAAEDHDGDFLVEADIYIDYYYDVWEQGSLVRYYDQKVVSATSIVVNSYDNGPTEITADDSYTTTNRSALEFSTAVNSDREAGDHPVVYTLLDDHGGAFTIDRETGIVSAANKYLFPDGQDFTITVKADDGVTVLTKTIDILMDRDEEVPPEIMVDVTTDIILPETGSYVGQFFPIDELDYNDTGSLRYAFECLNAPSAANLLVHEDFASWNFKLARDPLPSEIGVSLQFKMTLTDATGQTGEAFFELTVATAEAIVEGTAGNDTLSTDYRDPRPQHLYGLDGNDNLTATQTKSMLFGGDGDDILNFYAGDSFGDGGKGNDVINLYTWDVTVKGGEGADTIYAYGGAGTIVYDNIADSAVNNLPKANAKNAPVTWDTIYNIADDYVIDLSALGEIEWASSSTSSTSMLAYMEKDGTRPSRFWIDADRDGDYDFGIAFTWAQAQNGIQFEGLTDWMLT